MPAAEDDLALLVDAVRDAGSIALRHWRKQPKAWEKADGAGPVTEADLAVNDRLAALLRPARPSYGWLSEESADAAARLSTRHCFIIDPIDGTRSFIAGEDTFAVVAGISDGQGMRAGAVFLPALDRLYTAHADGPALRNGQPIRASQATDPDQGSMLTTSANMAAQYWPRGVPRVRRAFRPSLAYRLCLVAEGRHDSMVIFRQTWEWDIAAAALIVTRAGATISDSRGAPLTLNQADPRVAGVIAAPPELHAALIERTRPTP